MDLIKRLFSGFGKSAGPDLVKSPSRQEPPQIQFLDKLAPQKLRALETAIETLFDQVDSKPDVFNTQTLVDTLGDMFTNGLAESGQIGGYYISGLYGEGQAKYQTLMRTDVITFLELMDVYTVAWFNNVTDPLATPLNTDQYERELYETWGGIAESLGLPRDMNLIRSLAAYFISKYYPQFLKVFPKTGLGAGT